MRRCNVVRGWSLLILLLLLVLTLNVLSTYAEEGGGGDGGDNGRDDEAGDDGRDGDDDDDDIRRQQQWTCDELTPNLCPDLAVTESGQVPIRDGLSVKYWKYERLSSSSSSNNNFTTTRTTTVDMDVDDSAAAIPLILIHGGPSVPHNYLLPLKQQACRGRGPASRAVYLYDQAGCGESKLPPNVTNITEDLPFLLDKHYYALEELPTLIEYWGLTRYHILGNSWGTILSQYFALQEERPTGLVSLILSGPLSDGDLYEQSQWDPVVGNLGSLPPWVQQRVHNINYHHSYDTPEYKTITDVLTTFFTVRTAPAPDCWEASEHGTNREIYAGMQGPSEFTFGGTLAHFNTTPDLPSLDVPVLLTSGMFDTMRPPVVEVMYRSIPKVEWIIFQHSGHISMIDDAGLMNDAVDDFLNRVDEAYWSETEFVPKEHACGLPGCISNNERQQPPAPPVVTMQHVGHATNISYAAGFPIHVWVVSVTSFISGALIAFIVTQTLVRFRASSKDGYQPLS